MTAHFSRATSQLRLVFVIISPQTFEADSIFEKSKRIFVACKDDPVQGATHQKTRSGLSKPDIKQTLLGCMEMKRALYENSDDFK
jgi:hypothetical protein